MTYFSKFPRTFYSLDTNRKTTTNIVTTNILSRVSMRESIKQSSYLYYLYDIQDGDTPEIIAEKYYGNPNRHWIIMYANDMVDFKYDWPLTYREFSKYIEDKYGSYANSTTQIHHYEKVITKIDSVTQTITSNKYVVDANTYASLPGSSIQTINLKDGNTVKIETTKNIVYAYDYENELNELKRTIKIIDRDYVEQIENELTLLLEKNV